MRAFRLTLGFLAVAVCCCASRLQMEQVVDKPSGLRTTYSFYRTASRDTVRHGQLTRWYANGQKATEGFYWRGLPDSTWRTWNEAGKPFNEAHWRRGVLNGRYFNLRAGDPPDAFRTYGLVVADGFGDTTMLHHYYEGQYVDGLRVGPWTESYLEGWPGDTQSLWTVFGDCNKGKRDGLWVTRTGLYTGRRCKMTLYRMDQMVSEGPCTDSIFKSDSTAFEDMRKEIGRQMEAAKKYYGNQ
jgi:hypothetical protein